jgi:hypothetical protein
LLNLVTQDVDNKRVCKSSGYQAFSGGKGCEEMGFWRSTGVAKDKQPEYLAYYGAEVEITAFQAKEADLFNEVLTEHGDAMKEDHAAASEVRAAAQRLVEAAKEIIRRRDEMQPVPVAAFALHWAWHITSLTYGVWTQSTLAAMEALAAGMAPHYKYVQHVAGEHKAAWLKAQREEKKFLRQLRTSKGEIKKIVDQSIEAAKTDSWQPEMPVKSDDEVVSGAIVPVCS